MTPKLSGDNVMQGQNIVKTLFFCIQVNMSMAGVPTTYTSSHMAVNNLTLAVVSIILWRRKSKLIDIHILILKIYKISLSSIRLYTNMFIT